MARLGHKKSNFIYFKVLFVLFCIFLLIAGFVFTSALVSDPSIITVQFTSIGFAVFLSLANTCFAWARTLTTPDLERISFRLNRIAAISIFCALTFICTSLLQFLINQAPQDNQAIASETSIIDLLRNTRMIFIIIIILVSMGIVGEVLSIFLKLLFTEYFLRSNSSIKR